MHQDSAETGREFQAFERISRTFLNQSVLSS